METVTVYYRWHPLFGLVVPVWRRSKYGDGERIYCKAPDGRICVLPEWMLRPECAHLCLGSPLVSLEALAQLHDLLRDLKRSGFGDKGFLKLKLSRQEGSHEEASAKAAGSAQMNLWLPAPPTPIVPGGKQEELTQALMELLINAAQKISEHVKTESEGVSSESETHA